MGLRQSRRLERWLLWGNRTTSFEGQVEVALAPPETIATSGVVAIEVGRTLRWQNLAVVVPGEDRLHLTVLLPRLVLFAGCLRLDQISFDLRLKEVACLVPRHLIRKRLKVVRIPLNAHQRRREERLVAHHRRRRRNLDGLIVVVERGPPL